MKFAKTICTITASATAGGTITPSGTIVIEHGSNQTFTFSPAENYHISQVLIDDVNNPEAVSSGTYTFTNCEGDHTISVVFSNHPASIAGELVEMLHVYPNPVKDVMHIETDKTVNQILVLDMNGKVVKQLKGNHKTIDMQSVPAGQYIVKIHTETAVVPVKIVKQ